MTSLAMLQCIDTWKPPMFAIMPMQRFLKFRFFRQEYSGSPLEVVQLFRSTKIFILTLPFLTNRFIIAVLLLTYVANSEKEYKLVRARLLLVSPVSSDFTFLGWSTPHVINTILEHYAHFWIFWREFFVARKKRLAARGSDSQARKIASQFFSSYDLRKLFASRNRYCPRTNILYIFAPDGDFCLYIKSLTWYGYDIMATMKNLSTIR